MVHDRTDREKKKDELIHQIDTARENIIDVLNFSFIAISKKWIKPFEESASEPGTLNISIGSSKFYYYIPRKADLIERYSNPQVIENACFRIIVGMVCFSFLSTYERIKAFRKSDPIMSEKWDKKLKEPWVEITNTIRNAMTHDFKFELDKDVSYTFSDGDTFEIKITENGNELNGENLPIGKVLKLLDEIKSSVQNF